MNASLKKFLNRRLIKGAMIFDFFSPGIPYVIKNSGCEFVLMIWNMEDLHLINSKNYH